MKKFTKMLAYICSIMAIAIFAISCKKPTYTPPPDPIITDFSPKSAKADQSFTLTIQGQNFEEISNSSIEINGTYPTKIISVSPNTLVVEMKFEKSKSGSHKVKIHRKGDAESTTDFTIIPLNNVSVAYISPNFAGQDEDISIHIAGTSFTNILDQNTVTIDGIQAVVTKASPTALTILLPKGLSLGTHLINVTVDGETDSRRLTILDKNDVSQVRKFLSQVIRPEILYTSAYSQFADGSGGHIDIRNTRINFNKNGRLEEFQLYSGVLPDASKLELKGCEHLDYVDVENHNLTSINLTGASPDLKLGCKNNRLGNKSIKLSHPLKDQSYINPQQAGYGPATVDVK